MREHNMSNKKLLVLNSNGEVTETRYGYDPLSYTPQSYQYKTLIVDTELPSVSVSYSTTDSTFPISPITSLDGVVEAVVPAARIKNIEVSPLTEQVLRGNISGNFLMGEAVYQSTITPEIVNNYFVGGQILDDFVPTIGSIGVCGEIGVRAAQFKGTYNDLSTQKAAGIKLPAFTTSSSTPYFMVEGWVYLESEPSNNYDPILLTRSADGVNGTTNDSFQLEYDSGNNQFVFHFADSTRSSAGYNATSLSVCPVNGATLSQWHHFAVLWGRTGGATACMAYWNGNFQGSVAITGHLRNSTAPLMVGSGVSGDYPFKGWMEDIHIRMGGVTLALADYAYLGQTAAHLYEEDYPGDYTVYQMSMNGPIQTSLFPVNNSCRVGASVTYTDRSAEVIGVSLISREDSDVLGLTLFDGVCGGFTASGGTAANLFGFESGACMVINSVQQIPSGFSAAKDQRKNSIDYTSYFMLGATTMNGASGASGDFPKLFSSGWTGQSFSFLPTQSNINWLRNVYDNIAAGGYTGSTKIDDYYGNVYEFGMTPAKKLYEDVITYRANVETLRTSVIGQINSASTIDTLKTVSGFTTGVVLKIAQYSENLDSIYIPIIAKATKLTVVPESKNLGKYEKTILEPFDGKG